MDLQLEVLFKASRCVEYAGDGVDAQKAEMAIVTATVAKYPDSKTVARCMARYAILREGPARDTATPAASYMMCISLIFGRVSPLDYQDASADNHFLKVMTADLIAELTGYGQQSIEALGIPGPDHEVTPYMSALIQGFIHFGFWTSPPDWGLLGPDCELVSRFAVARPPPMHGMA